MEFRIPEWIIKVGCKKKHKKEKTKLLQAYNKPT